MTRSKTTPAEHRAANAIPPTGGVVIEPTETDLIIVSEETQSPSAHALVTPAPARPVEETAKQEIEALRRQIALLQANYTLQAANSEQARRVATCLRAFHEQLLHNISQPLLVLDRDGCVQDWNAALERLLHLPQPYVAGQPLASWFTGAACELLLRANQEAFAQEEEDEAPPCEEMFLVHGPLSLLPGITAERILLVPLSRIPGWVEATVALIELSARPEENALPLAA